ncbi:MAG TPA: NnrS family protein, partial [Candidatus Dormibacteraeota bacterium]|nr:NnrS family protein [Candidatus Dormibacteraeota bacterium]
MRDRLTDTSTSDRPTTVALFAATSLIIGLSVGFGLGLWLLLARVWGVTLFGANWLALVQVHGLLQLFGFAGLFAMGVALHALPRFRGAAAPRTALVWITYLGTLSGLALRSIAQLMPELPARGPLLLIGGALLFVGTLAFTYAAARSLVTGRNPHRPDELLIGAGICALPIAALLVALEMAGSASVIVDQGTADRAVWVMLLGGLSTLIVGVWARLAPGFVASVPAKPRLLITGGTFWLAGVLTQALGMAPGPWLLLVGFAAMTGAIGVFGAGIVRQPLHDHARLTRIGVRSAFVWAFIGLAIIAVGTLGLASSYLQISAARHALALGFVTLMIYAVAPRALPAFLGRRLWSLRLQAATLAVANLAVAMRVGPQLVEGTAAPGDAFVGLSGILAYCALVLFTLNVVRTLRGPTERVVASGAPVPLEIHFGR